MDETRPPHGLMGLQEPPGIGPADFGAILAAFLIVALAFYLWRRYRRSQLKPAQVERLTPWQELANDLGRIHVPTGNDSAAFYVNLSALLRRTLELRFGFPASSQTLPELEKSLTQVPELDGAERAAYLDFLRLSDRVKFVGHELDREAHRRWLEQLGRWIGEGKKES